MTERIPTHRLLEVAGRFKHEDAIAEVERRIKVMQEKFHGAPHFYVRRHPVGRSGRHHWWGIYVERSLTKATDHNVGFR